MGRRISALAGLLSFVGGVGLGCATGNPETTAGGDDGNGGAPDECARLADGAPCGDAGNLDCDKPDTCRQGTCIQNLETEGKACGDPTDSECNPRDSCDGLGACVERIAQPGDTCGDTTENACSAADACDDKGNCLSNHHALGNTCGSPDTNPCTLPDTCDGEGLCLANDQPADTPCGSQDDDACTNPDTCDGMGMCEPNDASTGTACGDQANSSCTDPDTCDGAGTCDDNHELLGVLCGSGLNTDCTNPDACDGGGICNANDEADTTVCNDCPQGAGLCDGCLLGGCTDACIPPPGSLVTLYAKNNSLNGAMFDVRAKGDITLTRVETNLAAGSHDVSVWYVFGGLAGHETVQADWTLVGTALAVSSNGTNLATEIPVDLNLAMNAGETYGILVHTTSGLLQYTNGGPGTAEGDLYVQNLNLEIYIGRGLGAAPFTSLQFFPRIFNGTVNYDIGCF